LATLTLTLTLTPNLNPNPNRWRTGINPKIPVRHSHGPPNPNHNQP